MSFKSLSSSARRIRRLNVVKNSYRPLNCEQLELRTVMSADAVLDWNDVALVAVANDHTPSIVGSAEQGGPTRTARALGIVHAAIFDAVNAIDHSYTSYRLKSVAPTTASIDAAAAQAAHDTLAALYPKQKAIFDAALVATLNDVPDGVSEQQGISIGALAAKTLLDARSNDKSDRDVTYKPGTQPGDHRVDPLHPTQGFLGPNWGSVTPFTLKNGSQFRADPPPKLSSTEYAAAFNEVKRLGGDGINTPTDRTAEQTEIGIFWAYDGVPQLGTPPRLYNQIVRQIANQQGNTEVQNARLFALVNLAMADAGIASWETKYQYDFWRPILGIREADPGTGPSKKGDSNPNTLGDANWMPLGAPASNTTGMTNFTPPFPAYTSGHATFGAATFRTLEKFFGRNDIAFSFQSDEFNGITKDANSATPRPAKTRSFTSLSQAALENCDSRIYLGIHWQFDATAGLKQGNNVADWAFANFLQPLAGPGPCHNHGDDSSDRRSDNSNENSRSGMGLDSSNEFASMQSLQTSSMLVLSALADSLPSNGDPSTQSTADLHSSSKALDVSNEFSSRL